MQIIIAGAGKYGRTIAGELVADGHDVTVIEKEEEVFESTMESYDLSGVVGNAASHLVLEEAGVSTCDVFLALTGSDEVNLVSAIIAQKLGARKTFARVVNPDYSTTASLFRTSLGIDAVINPNLESAQEIMRMLRYPSAISVESFIRGKVHIVAVKVPEKSILAGMPMLDFKEECGLDLMVCVIRREGSVFIPDGRTVIQPGDTIHVTGKVDTLQSFYARTNTMAPKIKRVLITGGGAIVYWLLGLMDTKRYTVKLIERDRKMAELIYKHYPWVDVIRADGTDPRVLEESNIKHYDAFIALTGIDEENVLASMAASHHGVPKTITKINRTKLLDILGDSELQNILTPHHIVRDEIVRAIRSLENSRASAVEAVYRFEEGRVEALEFVAGKESQVLDKTLLELNLRPSLRLACIVRGQEIIFPGGQDRILAGDRVIVISTGSRLVDLDDILGD
ncbi:MAG TPA: Trk system potassium transporter TrkA [Clostridiaceae bacterium]|nr:Trk system potassium transporter TrkA [Clostridiaceae bacterium]